MSKRCPIAFLQLLRPWWSQDLNQSQICVLDPQTMLNHPLSTRKGCSCCSSHHQWPEKTEKILPLLFFLGAIGVAHPASKSQFQSHRTNRRCGACEDRSRNSLTLHHLLYWEYLHREAHISKKERSKCLKRKVPILASLVDLLCDLRKITSFLTSNQLMSCIILVFSWSEF